MLTPQARGALLASPWLRGLPEALHEDAVTLFEEVTAPQGALLFREGDTPDAAYLIVEGVVEASRRGRLLIRAGPGEVFGAPFDPDQPRPVTVSVALDCRLLVLRRAHWPRLEELDPGHTREVARLQSRHLEVLLGRAGGAGSEYVTVRSQEPWPQARRTILALAAALEREMGAPVAIVTGCAEGSPAAGRPARRNGLDFVLAGDPSDRASFRERGTRALGALHGKIPFALIEIDDSIRSIDLGLEADLVIERIVGQELPEPSSRGRRVIFLHDRRDGSGPALSGADVVSLPLEAGARARAFERLARQVCGRSVGLALGSGAAWGLAHIGVLEVLDEAGVPIDLVAGSSMGAIVGAHYALGLSPEELREMATRVKTLPDLVRIVPKLLYLAADVNVTQPGLFAGQHFKNLLASIAPITGKTFADLEIPFRAVATDIETGARAELREGELSEAVHASFAAPGILSPHRVGDGVYIDGGMVDPVPAETVRRMGADLVIAVNVVPPLDPVARNPFDRALERLGRLSPLARLRSEEQRRLPGGFDAVVRTIQLMQYQLGNDRAGEADVLVNPELKEFWLLEFWAGDAMIARGAEATRGVLPQIQEKLAAWRKGRAPSST